MKQLVYISKATEPFDAGRLRDLTDVSQQNNRTVGVTGCMVYAGGYFLQLLEGGAEEVETTFRRIEADPRHRNSRVLLEREVGEQDRIYDRWFMSCVNLDVVTRLPAQLKENIDHLLNGDRTSMPIQRMFMEFRQHLSA